MVAEFVTNSPWLAGKVLALTKLILRPLRVLLDLLRLFVKKSADDKKKAKKTAKDGKVAGGLGRFIPGVHAIHGASGAVGGVPVSRRPAHGRRLQSALYSACAWGALAAWR